MMRNVSALMIWGIVLCALVILLGGCGAFFAQPGETAAEGHRRHKRNLAVYNDSIWLDLDRTVLFMDKPGNATDIRIPPRIDE
jgi:hypothetical protein